ncbi:MAG: insulinase family protein [Micrococcales bacterium]|nr:insulinase family protein [Micrococcales bacterium]
MSSRLFQEVRERRVVWRTPSPRSAPATATPGSSACTAAPRKTGSDPRVIDTVLLKPAGISEEEVAAAKNQVKGQMVLDLEDPGMRLMRLGTRALFGERIIALNEGLKKVEAVSAVEVTDLAQEILSGPAVDVVVGPQR